MIKETSYVCIYCHRGYGTAELAENCEKEHDRCNKEQQKRYKDRLERAKSLVNEPIRLLVKHGFEDEARVLCKNHTKWDLWDCGTSSGWEEVLDTMMEEAKLPNKSADVQMGKIL